MIFQALFEGGIPKTQAKSGLAACLEKKTFKMQFGGPLEVPRSRLERKWLEPGGDGTENIRMKRIKQALNSDDVYFGH